MTSHSLQISALLLSAVLVAGCVGSEAAKDTAKKSADLLKNYQLEAQKVLGQQKDLETQILTEVDRHTAEASTAKVQTQALVNGWRVEGDKGATTAFEALTAPGPDAIIAASPLLSPAAPSAATTSAKLSQDYDNAVKSVLELAGQGSAKERLKFLAELIANAAGKIKPPAP